MIVTQSIDLDFSDLGEQKRVYAKQYDENTRDVHITLYDGGVMWSIPAGTTAVVRYRKPDKKGGIYDELPNGDPACIVNTGSGTVNITLAPEVLTCPGDVLVDVVLVSGNDALATFNFVVNVERSPSDGTTPSNNYYKYQTLADINEAVSNAENAAENAEDAANTAQISAQNAANAADNAAAALASAVRSVNGRKPDSSGNVDVTGGSGTAGVTSINGQRGALTLPICGSAICGTSAGVAAKVAVLSSQNFTPVEGAILGVRFTATNTAANPTLQCASFTGPIADPTGELVAPGKITAGFHLFFRGPTAWILIGSAPDDDFLPVSGGIMTGPLQGTIASMDHLVARSRLVLEDTGYGKIYAKNVSDEGDPAIDLSDREPPGGNPVRVTGVKTPVQDNDAANKSYVDAKIGSGSAGKDGGYYAISVSQPSNDKMRVTLTPSKSDMPTVPAVDIDLPAGEDGQDGKSPTVTVTDITGGHRITVTDATGTKTFNVMDGTPGAQGVDGGYYTPVVTQVIAGSMHIAFAPSNDSMPVIPPVEIPLPAGEDGQDGVSPTVSVTDITGGHRVTITDADGTKTFDVMDGEDGSGSGGSVDIDDTLTQSGKAADAKVVGDALKLKFGIDGGDISKINVTSSLTVDSEIDIDFNDNQLKGVGDPVENGDAVNKKTMDQAIAGVAAGSTMIPDGYCSTPAATAAKLDDTFITASVTDGTPVMVNFVHQNTAENPTLTVNGVTAPILGMDAQPIAAAALTAGLHTFVYYTRYPGWVMLPEYIETNVDRTITLDESVSSVNIGSAANPLNLKRCVILLDINHDYTVRESAANGRIKTNGYNQGVVLQNMIIPTDATYDRPYMIYMEAFGEIVYCFVAAFNTTDDIVSNDNTVEGNMTWRAGRLIADNGRINTINIIGDAVDAGAFGAGTKIRIVGVE